MVKTRAKESITHIAYDKIKQHIIDLHLMPGTPLVESELSIRFNMSRTPIREAIKLLEAEGLVEIVLNKGAYIKKFTKSDFIYCYEVAEALEGMVTMQVCEKMLAGKLDSAYLEKLRATLERMDEALSSHNYQEWAHGDQVFHEHIYSVCENLYFLKMLSNVYIQLNSVLWYLTVAALDKQISQNEHWQIYRAIMEGHPEETRTLAQKHRERVRKIIADTDFSGFPFIL